MRNPASASMPGALSPGLRRYLYFTAAMTGGAIMIIEILGAKMLAPYVGTSHFVWTAQIAVTLVALAAGYYVGGRVVDRSTNLNRLYGCILAAAAYLGACIALVEPVAYGCLRFKLALGSLMASAFLFLVPLALLAMVGPFLIRVLTSSVQDVGGNTGRLTAVSTLGSFGGTVLIGYVLVPWFRNSVTMFLTAGALVAVAGIYFVVWGRSGAARAGTVAAGGIVALLGLAGVRRDRVEPSGQVEEIFRANSNFGQLQVLQDKQATRRFYLNDFLTQNTYDPSTRKSLSLFTYLLHDLTQAYAARVENVLCIGMGVGIAPMEFARAGVKVDLVEINPAVVPMAERFFDFEPGRLNLVIGDGRSFLNATRARYDAVVLDAFLGDSSPSHLMTREAFAAMQRVLTDEGVLVINSFGDFSDGKDFFTASLEKTLRAVFRSVRIHSAGNGNVFFVASNQPVLTVRRPPQFDRIHPHVRASAERAFAGVVTGNPAHGIVLMDDYNPVEFYDAGNREAWRRSMALSMQNL